MNNKLKESGKNWKTSWEEFIKVIANDINNNLSEEEISKKYEGQSIRWIGKISSIELEEIYARGIGLSMPVVRCVVHGGKFIQEKELFLHINMSNNFGNNLNIGDRISFQGQIRKRPPFFSSISISLYDDTDRVIVTFGIDNVKTINKV